VDWRRFGRRCLNDALRVEGDGVAALGCGDADQAVLYLLRTGPLLEDGRLDPRPGGPARVPVPGLGAGPFRAILWDTTEGRALGEAPVRQTNAGAVVETPRFGTDLAIAVRRVGRAGGAEV
jgi:mannan endo-1,4-beta-mannosidase